MPWILDTLIGRTTHGISGWWHPEHDMLKENLSVWKGPADHLLPLQVSLAEAPRVLPGLTSLVSKLIFANDAARAILEQFVPETLTFASVIVHMPKGKIYGQAIHVVTLPAACMLDGGLVVEKSDVRIVENYKIPAGGGRYIDGKPYLALTRDPPRLMWNRVAVGYRHLWADSKLAHKILISDQLYAALKSAGITGFQAQESRFDTEH